MFSAYEILDIAIKLEKNGEKVYREAMDQTGDLSLKELLKWMADEEVKHAEWFSELKSEVELNENHHLIREMSEDLVSEFVGEQSFSLKDVDFSAIKGTRELIEVFIEFERDTILFYEMLESFIIDEETGEKLNRILDEENDHISKLQERLPGPRV
ncbi:MAG: ferritin family protein [Desulfobulbaceae bacterium]|jgi:rubrerythrin|nr:ferritin family protein [Desulfobulbaceae bacterium]